MRILLVEDKNRLREAIAQAHKQTGYAVDSADNGNDALYPKLSHSYPKGLESALEKLKTKSRLAFFQNRLISLG